jgi:hypothetical protein
MLLFGGLELVEILSPGRGVTTCLALINWLRFVGYTGRIIQQVLVAPFVLLASIPMYVLRSIFGPTWTVTLISDVIAMACLVPGRQSELLMRLSTQAASSWIVRAVCEEITFRCILDWPLWLYRRLLATCNPSPLHPKEERRIFYGHAPWVVFKGLCFGAMHIEHWLVSGIEDASSKDQLGAISGATHQLLWCFLASVRVFDPLARKYGLVASVGAHATHNALGFGLKAALRMITGPKQKYI